MKYQIIELIKPLLDAETQQKTDDFIETRKMFKLR